MEERKSLYEVILEGMKDGEPGRHFSLPKLNEQDLFFPADGAGDVMIESDLYRLKLGGEGRKRMIKAVQYAAERKFERAEAVFVRLSESCPAVIVYEHLRTYIRKQKDMLPAVNMIYTALNMILFSSEREAVKFGLSMLSVYKLKNEAAKDVVRTIGLSDEFTFYAALAMREWDNANDEIFALIQKVYYWGRARALEWLEPTTPEIREWILLEGIRYMAPASAAAVVWQKSDAAERLQGTLTQEEFEAIGHTIYSMLGGGIKEYLPQIKNAEETILQYLSLADSFAPSIIVYEMIFDLPRWLKDEFTDLPRITERCNEILHSDHCRNTVTETVKEGRGIPIAIALGIDYAEDLYQSMKVDFEHLFRHCGSLMQYEGYQEKVIDLFREKLLKKDSGEKMNETYSWLNPLDSIIYVLKEYPNTGEDLVATGLRSPYSYTRLHAMQTLDTWCSMREKPLKEVSRPLYQELIRMIKEETEMNCLSMGQRLIRGAQVEQWFWEDLDD